MIKSANTPCGKDFRSLREAANFSEHCICALLWKRVAIYFQGGMIYAPPTFPPVLARRHFWGGGGMDIYIYIYIYISPRQDFMPPPFPAPGGGVHKIRHPISGSEKGVSRKRGLFRKVHFLKILENLEILENPQTLENKAERL